MQFSKTEKPAPIAKPEIAASSLKPMRLRANSQTTIAPFNASSSHGATKRL